MIPNLKNLEKIFQKMENDGFEIEKPLKWGFYFFDENKEKLEKIYLELKNHDYKLEKYIKMDDNLWRLFVTKVEILQFQKLHRRNIAFNDLAKNFNIKLYDGWDVEKI
jgi:Regulator of ribonuclease activity B